MDGDTIETTHLLHERQHVIGSPALRLPRIVIRTLAAGVHHPVDG
jgi:hypothetical protein